MKSFVCLLAFCTLAYAQYGEKRSYGRKDSHSRPVEPIDPIPLPVDPFPRPVDPVAEKPGQCPIIADVFTPCVVTPENNECSNDFHCRGQRKCCGYGCGTRCLLPLGTEPIITKRGCKYNGKLYKQGASFPSTHGCNTCTCGSHGRVSCTEKACSSSCYHYGHYYSVGESFSSHDGCDTCTCGSNGQVVCIKSLRACIIPPRNLPQCLQPKESGMCLAAFRRWWFNKPERRCEPFIYGGCGGNENNFETKAECLRTCGSKYRPSISPRRPRRPSVLV